MTDKEREEKQAEAIKAAAKVIAGRKAAEIKAGFLNPFGEKTTYDEFMSEVTKSKKSVAEYCKGKLSEEEMAWLTTELEHYNNLKSLD